MNRRIISTECIKIREYPQGESDVFLDMFTRSKGTIRALVPGLKRSRRRFPGSIRKYCIYDIDLYKGKKDYYRIDGARFLEGFDELSNDFMCYCSADYILQIIQHFYPENMESSYVFDSLKMFLRALKGGREIRSAVKWMEIRILNDSGYLSRLTLCSRCGTIFSEGDMLYYNRDTGHTYCKKCKKVGRFAVCSTNIKYIIENALWSECEEFILTSGRDADFYDRITTETIIDKLGFFPRSLAEIVAKNKRKS